MKKFVKILKKASNCFIINVYASVLLGSVVSAEQKVHNIFKSREVKANADIFT